MGRLRSRASTHCTCSTLLRTCAAFPHVAFRRSRALSGASTLRTELRRAVRRELVRCGFRMCCSSYVCSVDSRALSNSVSFQQLIAHRRPEQRIVCVARRSARLLHVALRCTVTFYVATRCIMVAPRRRPVFAFRRALTPACRLFGCLLPRSGNGRLFSTRSKCTRANVLIDRRRVVLKDDFGTSREVVLELGVKGRTAAQACTALLGHYYRRSARE